MRTLFDTLRGLWELLVLGARTRFRFHGPYWRWRIDTAFGSEPAAHPPRRQMIRAIVEYARWIARMKRCR